MEIAFFIGWPVEIPRHRGLVLLQLSFHASQEARRQEASKPFHPFQGKERIEASDQHDIFLSGEVESKE